MRGGFTHGKLASLALALFLFSIPHPWLKIRSAVTCDVFQPEQQREMERKKKQTFLTFLTDLSMTVYKPT